MPNVNVRLSPDPAKATRARAEQEERTASAVIRRALKQHLAEPAPARERELAGGAHYREVDG